MLSVTRLSDKATLPTYGSDKAAGLDLYSTRNVTILPGGRELVQLDIAIELPPNTYGHILPRSGLALKKGIHVGAGVIDEDYRGCVSVLLFNLGFEKVEFEKGDRIAQLVVKPYVHVQVVENELSKTERGDGGFGSTGQ